HNQEVFLPSTGIASGALGFSALGDSSSGFRYLPFRNFFAPTLHDTLPFFLCPGISKIPGPAKSAVVFNVDDSGCGRCRSFSSCPHEFFSFYNGILRERNADQSAPPPLFPHMNVSIC